MNYLYSVFEIIATFSESAIIFYAIWSLFEPRFKKHFQICGIIVSYLIISMATVFFNTITVYSGILDMTAVLLYIIAALILYKGNIFFRAVTPVILMIIILIINISVNVIMSSVFNIESDLLLDSRDSLRAVSLFITKFTFLLVVQISTRKLKRKSFTLTLDEWIGIAAVFIISVFILISAAEIQYEKIDSRLNMIVLIYGIAIINILTFAFLNKMAQKNKNETLLQMMQVHEKEQKKAFQSLEDIYKTMQILKHDMKNEWIVVLRAIKSRQYDYAEKIAEKMLNSKIESFEEYVSISNPAVNALLNYKLNIAKQKGININSYVQEDFESFDDYDIVMLISNLLDNAIEASENISDSDIDIMITTKMNYLSIVIANKIDESVLKENRRLKTTKSDTANHGLGTKSVKQICEKYNGMIDYYEKDNMFIADVMLKKQTPDFD